jgi:probable rRNA maturation factor
MITVDLQVASDDSGIPPIEDFRLWVRAAVKQRAGELTIRVVDRQESEALNSRYRLKAGPTNVLSFPFAAPPGVPTDLLGDIVICAPLVEEEARAQGKDTRAHWAHLTIHGVLHLLGFDHEEDDAAAVMEAEEVAIMTRLSLPNPYVEV